MSKNKYTGLVSNTVVFGISTFGSKVLILLLQPLYTSILAPEATSTTALITNTSNLILPIMYLCMAEAVIRFGLDRAYRKSDVFSSGFWTVLAGYAVLWCFYPLIDKIEKLAGYTWLLYLYVITSAMRTLITQFVRSMGMVRLFAMDGIFTSATFIACTLIFLLGFDLGVTGYVMATIVADAVSALSLFFLLRLYRYVKIRGIKLDTTKQMLRYALPLVPTAVGWWVTNLSDQYFVAYICGDHINGLYVKAYLLPNLITQVSGIFTRAWEISAFTEYKSEAGGRFFSNVFRSYYTLVFVLASGLILLIKPLFRLGFSESYYAGWQYVPLLVLAVSFSCLVTFLGAIYNAAKKNLMVSVSTIIGALTNVGLNAWLIPLSGAQGAAFATFISFLVVFLIRAVDTRKYVKLKMQPWRIGMNLVLLLAQTYVALGEKPWWILWECLIFALIVLCNFGYLLFLARRLLAMLPFGRKAKSS